MKISWLTLFKYRHSLILFAIALGFWFSAWKVYTNNITSIVEESQEINLRRGVIVRLDPIEPPPTESPRRGVITHTKPTPTILPTADYSVSVTEQQIEEAEAEVEVITSAEPLVTFDTRPTDVLLEEAKHLLSGPDVDGAYDQAMADLRSIILREPRENAKRAHEWLGIAYEKIGKFDKAMNEYALYLTLYPEVDRDRDRVRQRLITLEITAPKPSARDRSRGRGTGDSFKSSGSLSQYLYFGSSSPYADIIQWDTQQMNSITGFQFSARKEHNQYVVSSSLRFTNVNDLLDSRGDRSRLYVAYVEFEDLFEGYRVVVGRQYPRAGAVSTFDGVFGSYDFNKRYTVQFVAGYPYFGNYSNTSRFMVGTELDWRINRYFDLGGYVNQQTADGLIERRAFGTSLDFHNNGNFGAIRAEYDSVYQALNLVNIYGRTSFGKWDVFSTYDYRRSPILYGDTALTLGLLSLNPINGTYRSVGQLLGTSELTDGQIRDYIEKSTPTYSSIVLGVNRRLNKDWIYTFNLQSFSLSSTQDFDVSPEFTRAIGRPSQQDSYTANFHLRGDNFLMDNNSTEFVIGSTTGTRDYNYVTVADHYRFGDSGRNSIAFMLRYSNQNYGYAIIRTTTGMVRGIYRINDSGSLEFMYSRDLILSPQYRTIQAFYVGYRYDF